jgi:hypothetical protein
MFYTFLPVGYFQRLPDHRLQSTATRTMRDVSCAPVLLKFLCYLVRAARSFTGFLFLYG